MIDLTFTSCDRGAVCLRGPVLMGVLNLTPDSFSDGAAYGTQDAAFEHAMGMLRDGARVIDVGAESTRPGAEAVAPEEQVRRIGSVIRRVDGYIQEKGLAAVISIDTTSSRVAEHALDQGALMINDVSAGRDDPGILRLAAERGAAVVLMHMRGTPRTMQDDPAYKDVTGEVLGFLLERVEVAREAGVSKDRVWLDPGIGFGKTLAHNLELLGNLDAFVGTGHPVLLGASRKRFIVDLSEKHGRVVPGTDSRVGGTVATTVIAAQAGVAAVRVHDVQENQQALDLIRTLRKSASRTSQSA